jgi:hypothetical protein
MRIALTSALLFLACANTLAAQTPLRITGALVDLGSHDVVSVSFSDALAAQGPQEDIKQVRITGAPKIEVRNIMPSGLQDNVLTVSLSGQLPPGDVQICFNRVTYVRASVTRTTSAEVCAPVSADIETPKAAALRVLTETPVTPDEKMLNASGFVITASDNTEGGADLSFNPKLADPNATAFFRLKKSTAEEGDLRHLEVGGAYRIGIPWNRAQLVQLREAADLATVGALLSDRQRSFIAGSVINVAMKLEGEPTTFDAANGVGEAHYQIHSMTKALLGSQGFWRAYVIPAGVEVGRKLGVDEAGSPTADHLWIARYKTGAGMKLFYQTTSDRSLVRRVDFDVNGIWRYLGVEELNFNNETKMLDRTTDGGHGYVQADLKVFLTETPSGRFGVKVSYNYGSLPPAFAKVDSFQFGFIIESNDQD